MLDTMSRARLRRLSHSDGTAVLLVIFSLFQPFSLLRILTRSGNIYLIETISELTLSGISVHVARESPAMNARTGYLGIRHIDEAYLSIGRELVYRSKKSGFTTSPIESIRILIS